MLTAYSVGPAAMLGFFIVVLNTEFQSVAFRAILVMPMAHPTGGEKLFPIQFECPLSSSQHFRHRALTQQ